MKRRACVTRLGAAIDAYLAEEKDTLDDPARRLLARLASSPEARQAFERLKLEQRRDEAAILNTCIQADNLARTFGPRIKMANATAARMLRLWTSVAELTVFLAELFDEHEHPPQLDPLSVPSEESPTNIAIMQHGLALISGRIVAGWRTAKEDVLRLGATRKANIKQAGENAAIGWICEGIRRVTGRAHFSAVRELAQVTLRVELDDLDRIRRCANVRKREWRKSLQVVQLGVRPSPKPRELRQAIWAANRRIRRPKTG